MVDPSTVIRLWRIAAADRKQKLLESLARGLPESEYMHGCGRIKELDYQIQFLHDLITGKSQEVNDADAED